MSIRNANNENLEELYRNHIEKDFPEEERASLGRFLELSKNGLQDVLIYSEEGKDIAYCVVATVSEYLLISLLAVYDEYRGKGFGSKMLLEVKEYYSDKSGIIVEVEKPEDATNEAEKVMRERRIAFYEKAGYVLFRDIDYILWEVPYFLMVNGKSLSSEELVNEVKQIYGKLLRPQHQNKLKIQLS